MADIVLVAMSTHENAPYLSYYTQILDKIKVEYDMILWDRTGENIQFRNSNYHIYDKISDLRKNPLFKAKDMLGFAQFANRIIKRNGYKKIVVFTIQTAIFTFQSLLTHRYQYIIDVRDYSPLLRVPFLSAMLKKLIRNSYATVLSSPDFEYFLLKNQNYLISHNTNISRLECTIDPISLYSYPIKILTIGLLRDADINKEILLKMRNDSRFRLDFVGKGIALPTLQKVAEDYGIENVYFGGPYNKEDELEITKKCNLINAIMPDNLNSRLLLSNRLYLSVVVGRPIIVNSESAQGEIIKKYNLGVCVNGLDNIKEVIMQYISEFDLNKYNEGRIAFIGDIKKDIQKFTNTLTGFIQK